MEYAPNQEELIALFQKVADAENCGGVFEAAIEVVDAGVRDGWLKRAEMKYCVTPEDGADPSKGNVVTGGCPDCGRDVSVVDGLMVSHKYPGDDG